MRSALALALVLAGCMHSRTPPPTANVTTAVPDVREWENHTRVRDRREQVAAADWFFLSGRDPLIPRRFADVAGFEVVRLLSRRHSADELLRLSPPAILGEIRTALARPSFCLESR